VTVTKNRGGQGGGEIDGLPWVTGRIGGAKLQRRGEGEAEGGGQTRNERQKKGNRSRGR
jgi:hypothetical protein